MNAQPTRRQFLTAALAAGFLPPRSSRAADARIEVLINEPIGTIAPEIYGHFVEHLGGVVYDGIWVGERSGVPNVGGVRTALIEHLKRTRPGIIRWPGGCYADQYDWHDGIGSRGSRPRRTNFWADSRATERYAKVSSGPQKYEPNEFGTNEFIRFCRAVGAQPYLAANVRSLPVKAFIDWVEYCNAPAGASTLADQRTAAGDRDPFDVRYWGIGNESWGCGGEMTPEEYATEYRKFTAWVPTYGGSLRYIAAGPNGGDIGWTRRFFTKLLEKGQGQLRRLYGWALHYYTGTTGKDGPAEYTTEEWYDLITRADRMDTLITQHWAAMGESDSQHQVKLVVDEWGAWHRQDNMVPDSFLFGYFSTLRDALIAGLTLDTFNRHADKVAMANVAQLVNTIHSLFVAYEDKFVLTPNFHVFEMYAAHQSAQAVRTLISAPTVTFTRMRPASPGAAPSPTAATLWGLQGSASMRDKQLVLTVVNPHATDARECEIVTRGGRVRAVEAQVLTAGDIHALNTVANPDVVRPARAEARASDGLVVHTFARASVTKLTMTLE